jgi:outer membrane protein assembly factor BamB
MPRAAPAKGGDWTNFILNYNDTRYQANSTINSSNIANIVEDWQINAGTNTATPIVVNGNVYFDDWNGGVYDANIITGSTKYPNWQVNLGGNAISSTPTVFNGMVYVTLGPDDPQRPTVYALSQDDGHIVWQTTLPTSMNQLYGSPIIFNGLIYVGVSGDLHDQEVSNFARGEIFALNENTGDIVWNYYTELSNSTTGGDGVWDSFVVDPQLNDIYFGTANPYDNGTNADLNSYWADSLLSMNATTGRLNWAYQTHKNFSSAGDVGFGATPNLFTLTIDGTTYNAIGDGEKDGWYYILERDTGKPLEKFLVSLDSGDGIRGVSGYIYLKGIGNPEIFILSDYNNVSMPNVTGVAEAIYPSNDTVAWRFYTPGVLTGSVSIIPGAALFGDSLGNFYALNTTTGNVILHKNFGTLILAGITPAEGYILVPLAGYQNHEAAGVVALSLPLANITGSTSITTTIPSQINSASPYLGLTASNTVIDAGQYTTLIAKSTNNSTSNYSVMINSGHSLYTFYFVNAQDQPVAVIYGINGSCSNIEGLVAASCTIKESIGNFSYDVVAKNNAETINSTPLYLNVYGSAANPNGNVPTVTITPSNQTNSTTPETFTIAVNGGKGPFKVQVYNVTKAQTQVGNTIIINLPGGSKTIQFNLPSAPGTYSFQAVATDMGTNDPFVFNSTKIKINITSGGISSVITHSSSSANGLPQIYKEMILALVMVVVFILGFILGRRQVKKKDGPKKSK